MENFKQKLQGISCFIFDVDGVLTDGSLILLPDGHQVRTMNIRDGYAMQHAVKNGYKVIIISGGKSEAVKSRLNGLGITDVYLDTANKNAVLDEVIKKYNLAVENMLYMGDDIPDLEPMQRCSIAACPSDAATEIREVCMYISDKNGGGGCVRDVIEQTMRLHGKWHSVSKR